MKRIICKKIVIIFTLFMVFKFNQPVFATDSNANVNFDKLDNNLELSFDELVDTINLAFKDEAEQLDLLYYAERLHSIIVYTPIEKILEEIENNENNNYTRVLLLQISADLDLAIDYSEVEYMLYQDNVDFEIKRNILTNISMVNKNSDIIEKIALSDNERLAFHAIKCLYELSPNKANDIAEAILKQINNNVGYKERAAFKIRALSLQEDSTLKERKEFLNICDKVLNDENSDFIIVDTIMYALSSIKSVETLKYVVESDKADIILKNHCINENYSPIYNEEIYEHVDEVTLDGLNCDEVTAINEMAVTSSTENMWAKGYALYRNGAILGTTWHGGIMNQNIISYSNSIIHIGGIGGPVTTCNLSIFEDGKDFMGYYLPNRSLTASQLTSVVNTARQLLNNDIGYNLYNQINYDEDAVGTKVSPDEIKSIRCDGVVEYCYEYNNIRVYGSDSNWNISINSKAVKSEHSGTKITPESQAKQYMNNMLGDVNADRYVTAEDANLVLNYAAKLTTFNSYQTFVSDVNGDGVSTAEDAQLILKYAAKLITIFPGDPKS